MNPNDLIVILEVADLKEVLEELFRKEITPILEQTRKFTESVDSAFNLLEIDPHSFSTRPCQTCQQVTALIGRDFGCVKRRKGGVT